MAHLGFLVQGLGLKVSGLGSPDSGMATFCLHSFRVLICVTSHLLMPLKAIRRIPKSA